MTMASLGQVLRKAREQKGMTLEEVSKLTKLPERNLHLMENDQWEELPAPTYVKGFLRLYAQAVGLQTSALIEQYQKGLMSQTKQVLYLEAEKIGSVNIAAILGSFLRRAAVVIGALLKRAAGFIASMSVGLVKSVKVHVWAAIAGLLLFSLAIFQIFKAGSTPPPVQSTIESEPIQTQAPSAVSTLVMPDEARPSGAASVTDRPVQQTQRALISLPHEKPMTLTGQVRETVWLRVHCDDTLVFEGTLKKGARETWQAAKYFKLRLGNVDSIRFSLDGKELGRIGPTGKVRNIRLTREGWYISD